MSSPQIADLPPANFRKIRLHQGKWLSIYPDQQAKRGLSDALQPRPLHQGRALLGWLKTGGVSHFFKEGPEKCYYNFLLYKSSGSDTFYSHISVRLKDSWSVCWDVPHSRSAYLLMRKCALDKPCSGTHNPSPLLIWLDHGGAPTYGWPNQWWSKIEMAWLKKMSQDKSILSGKSRIGSGKTGPVGHWRWKCSYDGAMMLAESSTFLQLSVKRE